MLNRKLLSIGLLTSVLITGMGCAATSTHRSAGQVVDDSALTSKVKMALVGDKDTKARDINVEVHDAQVQLNGFVDSAYEKSEATKVASSVAGVRSVRNNLEVSAKRTAGEAIDDSVITAKVKAALIGDSRTKAYQIEVNTNEGVVQLGGFVDSADAKSAASEVTQAVSGVRNVHNRLSVK